MSTSLNWTRTPTGGLRGGRGAIALFNVVPSGHQPRDCYGEQIRQYSIKCDVPGIEIGNMIVRDPNQAKEICQTAFDQWMTVIAK
jgi:hypothetical protein